MTTTWKEGDRIQIADREATAEDVKSGLFYNYFRGLTGTIQKLYATEEVAIEVDNDSLEEAVLQRHLDVQEQMKTRWLEGLSEEARNRLSEQDRVFLLHYTILVPLKDLTAGQPKSLTPAVKATPAIALEASAPRLTAADYAAAEEEYLKKRQSEG